MELLNINDCQVIGDESREGRGQRLTHGVMYREIDM